MSASKKVLIILTGSIACYKVCHVISRLVQAGHEVQVVASASALKFIGSATLEGLSGRPVISDMYASGNVMEHIHLMRWADLVLVAPATANFINKAAQGIGDDLVQTLFLAHDFKRPFLVAPAMNTSMYLHPTTQKSRQLLQDMHIEILETASGVLACGEQGWGRLLDPDLILQAVLEKLGTISAGPVAGRPLTTQKMKRVLVTAGGTQEAIDTVRAITNTSTGRTGIQLAEYLESLGLDVTLVKSQTSRASSVAKVKTFSSFLDLQDVLKQTLAADEFDFVIHAAAVSDYSVDSIEVDGKKMNPLEVRKISSTGESMNLHLKRNPKLVNELSLYSKNKYLNVIAFKLTSGASTHERLEAVQKLQKEAGAVFVVHNDLSEIKTEMNQHRFTVYDAHLKTQTCESLSELCGFLSQALIEVSL